MGFGITGRCRVVQQAPQPKPKSTPNGAPSFFSHYYSPSLSLFPLSFPNKTAAAGSAACRTMPPAQSHPTAPGLSWDIYDTSRSCHVNPPGEGGPKSSCQGAGRTPLWKRTSLSDTREASGISGSPPPPLPLFWVWERSGARQEYQWDGGDGSRPSFCCRVRWWFPFRNSGVGRAGSNGPGGFFQLIKSWDSRSITSSSLPPHRRQLLSILALP